jgi:hypothetical protein
MEMRKIQESGLLLNQLLRELTSSARPAWVPTKNNASNGLTIPTKHHTLKVSLSPGSTTQGTKFPTHESSRDKPHSNHSKVRQTNRNWSKKERFFSKLYH